MNVLFDESFQRDLKKIKERPVLEKIRRAIEGLEAAETLDVVAGLKKLEGAKDRFRVRIGDYRIGFKLTGASVVFLRVLNRKDFYRFFP
jgi:mRNA interferase RelE/StbE